MTKTQDLYLRWLEHLCGLGNSKDPSETYHGLFCALNSIEFYSLIPRDDNRASDGKELRQVFMAEYPDLTGDDFAEIDTGPCTFLEMMIGLAKRMDYELGSQDGGNQVGKWFFEMIRNLGLERYNDALFFHSNGNMAVKTAAMKVVDREFDSDGTGGLFPLKRPKTDQRSVEIWYQMNSYLMECYTL